MDIISIVINVGILSVCYLLKIAMKSIDNFLMTSHLIYQHI